MKIMNNFHLLLTDNKNLKQFRVSNSSSNNLQLIVYKNLKRFMQWVTISICKVILTILITIIY